MAELGVLFNKAQKTITSHTTCCEKAEALILEDPEKFVEDFFCFLPVCLSVPKQEPSIGRLLQFIVRFATTTTGTVEGPNGQQNVPFWSYLLEQLVHYTTVQDKSIRWRSCSLVGDILRQLPEDCEIRCATEFCTFQTLTGFQ